MSKEKSYTIVKTARGVKTVYTGTLVELRLIHNNLLAVGNSWCPKKVNTRPETVQELIKALNAAIDQIQPGAYYNPRFYLKNE